MPCFKKVRVLSKLLIYNASTSLAFHRCLFGPFFNDVDFDSFLYCSMLLSILNTALIGSVSCFLNQKNVILTVYCLWNRLSITVRCEGEKGL